MLQVTRDRDFIDFSDIDYCLYSTLYNIIIYSINHGVHGSHVYISFVKT